MYCVKLILIRLCLLSLGLVYKLGKDCAVQEIDRTDRRSRVPFNNTFIEESNSVYNNTITARYFSTCLLLLGLRGCVRTGLLCRDLSTSYS
jgi:hypothetical protein